MLNKQEGVIKYQCHWDKKPINILSTEELEKFNYWRNSLVERGVIGVDVTGVGFGNISIRISNRKEFIITGSQTGHLKRLSHNDLSLVTEYSITGNFVRCSGLSKASSEALTHAAIYNHSPQYGSVIHIHSHRIWKLAKETYPVTNPTAEYGTSELALSVEMTKKKIDDNKSEHLAPIIILGGHPDGIIIFETNLDLAGSETIKLIDSYR